MRNRKEASESFMSFCFILTAFIVCFHLCNCEKIRYAEEIYCDRHSLDAVYHEKYKLITNNIFTDMKEFATRVSDLVADSLTSVMADLPDRDVSDDQERKIFTQFKNLKGAFTSKVRKIQKNITSAWEELIVSHFDLMFDNGKSSLEDYQDKILRMTDSYSEARKTLDSTLSSFIAFIKNTVQHGLLGIKAASQQSIKEEKAKKKNETEEVSAEETAPENKSPEEVLQDKMVEIAKMIVPGFLGKATIEAIQRKMDLSKASSVKPEDRDSVLDDIIFDMTMVKNRMRAIIQTDVPRDKGATDLARRSIYTYWADQAEEMYKDKLRSKQTTDNSNTGRLYYINLWKDEDKIVETLLNLMEVYP